MSVNIRVLFGTETGNAEACAMDLGDALEEGGFEATVTDMGAFEPQSLSAEALAIIITSTYGNGDPPYNAEALMEWLGQPESSIAGVSFAVCGLGDTGYPKFCQAGKDFDRLLEERGGRRIQDRVDCDVYYEEPFEQFTEGVVNWLKANADSLQAPSASSEAAASSAPSDSATETSAPLGTRANPVSATLVSRRRLNQAGSNKETLHYEFQWTGQDVAYAPGDSFAVLPENNPTEVDAILQALRLEPSTQVNTESGSLPLRETLLRLRDLQTVSSELFEAIAGEQGPTPTAEHLHERHVLDVANEHPKATISAQALADSLKKMRPRLYSVANSPLVEPQGVHFTVETLRYTRHGRDCEGVATTWLADRVQDGESIPMYCVQANYFRLPEATDVPVIMIGPGTGIAPFRAYLQHRKAQGATGPNWLFFGHQHANKDFLYEEELKAFQESGDLSKLSLAWSRDQAEKIYVQTRLKEEAGEVWAWIQKGAFIYVCGDKNSMAPQVRDTFVEIAIREGGLSEAKAQALIENLEETGRYCVDAY